MKNISNYSSNGRASSCVTRILTNMEDLQRDRIGQRPYHEHTGDNICPSMIRGIDYLRDPKLNKVKKILLFFYYNNSK